jgi:hypothetical protein
VWQTGNCANYGSYSLIAANDDSGDMGMFGTDPALHNVQGLTPGAPYYIQLDGYLGARGKGMLVVDAIGGSTETLRPGILPSRIEISQAIPNPSDGRFIVRLSLPQAAAVDLRLLDVAGREVARRNIASMKAGYNEIVWDTVTPGTRIPRGVYYLDVRVGKDRQVRKVVVRF